MDDLVQFLRARLDEERTEAEKQPDGEEAMLDGWEIIATAETNYPCYEYLRIAKRRVLADIDAKRELIKRGDTLFCECDFADSPPTNPEDRSQEIPHHYDCTAYRVAAVLALPYADHPDYREDWRP